MDNMDNLQKIVLLIDADNTQVSKIEAVIREISTHGRIVVKRAYGNWKKGMLKNWENELKRLAIKAEQQFDYVTGKNATDMALVIDTMDLLHKEVYDAFVIVASDNDYTPLAIKLHESGVYVFGVGEKKTPEAFRNACDEFIFLENLSTPAKAVKETPKRTKTKKKTRTTKESAAAEAENAAETELTAEPELENTGAETDFEEIHNLLRIASDKYQDDDGYVNVSSAGTFIKRAKPDFDSRTYGFVKLPQLIAAFPDKYEIKKYPGKGTVTIIAYKCL